MTGSGPLRVLQVVTAMETGGLETFIMNNYRHMNRDAVQFDFLCHRQRVGAYGEEIDQLGGLVFHVPRCNPFNPAYRRALDAFFSEHTYEVVHSHIDCMSALPLAAARRHGVPCRIAHAHSSKQDKDVKYPVKYVCKRFIEREATALFACDPEAGAWMFGTGDFKVLRNAIDVSAFRFDDAVRAGVRREIGARAGDFVIGHVGRFDDVKNHAFLIDVFAALHTRNPHSLLVLVGEGHLLESCKARVRRLGLEDSVRFTGLRVNVSDYLQAMDAFVMPSLYEGLPLALVEAQAAGLPCIVSTNIPHSCDICEGLVVHLPLGNSAYEWAEAVVSHRPRLAREAAARLVTEAGFDVRREASKLACFYLAGGKTP